MSFWRSAPDSTARLLQLCAGYFSAYVVTGIAAKYFTGGIRQPPLSDVTYLVNNTLGGTLLYAVNDWLHSMQPTPEVYATVAVPLFVGVFMAAATFFVGIGSKILDDLDREWASRFGAWVLVAAVGWLAICGVVARAYP